MVGTGTAKVKLAIPLPGLMVGKSPVPAKKSNTIQGGVVPRAFTQIPATFEPRSAVTIHTEVLFVVDAGILDTWAFNTVAIALLAASASEGGNPVERVDPSIV